LGAEGEGAAYPFYITNDSTEGTTGQIPKVKTKNNFLPDPRTYSSSSKRAPSQLHLSSYRDPSKER
jgi:hypothetical protein